MANTPPITRGPAEQNETFLNVLQNEAIPGSESFERRRFEESFFPPSEVGSMRLELENHNRSFELRSRSGLTTIIDENHHQSSLSALSSSLLARVFRQRIQQSLKDTANRSSEVQSLSSSFESVGRSVSSAAQLASTEPTGDLEFKTGAGLVLPASKARFWTESKLLNATFEVQYARPWSLNPWGSDSPGIERDPLLLTFSRQIPGLGVDSSLRYGFSTTWVEGVLSKNVLPNLRASLTAQSGLNPVRAGLPPSGEKTVRVDYEIKF